MTIQRVSNSAGPWTPRVVVQLAVLAAAALTYVTAEILPVGALSAIATNLDISEAVVGSLLAWYAVVAAVSTVPLVRWTAHWPRRRTLLLALACLAVSQIVSALAPTFAVLVIGRTLCAVTHGLLWAVIAPIATRLVPATHFGRATTAIYVGSSLGLVVGIPTITWISLAVGWRPAVALVAAAGIGVLLAARAVLPPMDLAADQHAVVGAAARHHRNGRLITVAVLTLVVVIGHFISYTFILAIIREVLGIDVVDRAHAVSWLLVGYGIIGVAAMSAVARPLDRRPAAVATLCMSVLCVAFVVLTALAFTDLPTRVTIPVGIAMILLWGATAATVSPMLQSAAMRTAPTDPDGASGLYVAAFQIGIAAGSLAGGVLSSHAGLGVMMATSTGLFAAVLVGIVVARRVFDVSSVVSSV